MACMCSSALLVLPSLLTAASAAASATCALSDKGAAAGTRLLQSRAALATSFVPDPRPQAYADLAPGQRQRLSTPELVRLPLSLPGVERNLSIFGYPVAEDEYVSGSVASFGSWEGDAVQRICELFRRHPQEGFNFLDVGGNIGTIALPVAAALGRLGGRVFAVEAMPSIAEHLKAGVVENGLRNVDLYPYAVSGPVADNDLVMELEPTNKGGSTVAGNKALTSASWLKTRVPLTTLDAMLGQEPGLRRVLAAKIDIEGNEGRALQGATRFLREAAPCYLMIELNAQWLWNAGTPIEGVVRLLGDAGYDAARVSLFGMQTYWLQQVDMTGCLARLAAAAGPGASA